MLVHPGKTGRLTAQVADQQHAEEHTEDQHAHATQLDPKNEEALFKLGVAYAYSGNYKVAVFKWEQVLKINQGWNLLSLIGSRIWSAK